MVLVYFLTSPAQHSIIKEQDVCENLNLVKFSYYVKKYDFSDFSELTVFSFFGEHDIGSGMVLGYFSLGLSLEMGSNFFPYREIEPHHKKRMKRFKADQKQIFLKHVNYY